MPQVDCLTPILSVSFWPVLEFAVPNGTLQTNFSCFGKVPTLPSILSLAHMCASK